MLAHSLMESSLVWDNHSCPPFHDRWEDYFDNLERYRKANVDIVAMNIGYGEMNFDQHIEAASRFQDWISKNNDRFIQVKSVTDIKTAQESNHLGIFFDVEGTLALEDKLERIETLYNAGVRWMLLAYNHQTLSGSGVHADDKGLTGFGRELIREMERLGMTVCCSHTGERTALEAIEYANNPVIFSHSNPRAMKDHPRNISDEVMKACATSGGVIGLNGIDLFNKDNSIQPCSLADTLEYMLDTIGEDHIGIGIDFVFDIDEMNEALESAQGTFPEGWGYKPGIQIFEPNNLPHLMDEMINRGHSKNTLRKILGQNWLRIADQVWK